MADKPSGAPSADAEFERWFAEQDPFGTTRSARQIQREKTAQEKTPAPSILRFGSPYVSVMIGILGFLGILALAFFIGTRL